MVEPGCHAGDSHLHLPRLTDEDGQIVFDLIEAGDFRYCGVLAYNEPANRYEGSWGSQKYSQTVTDVRTVRKRGNFHIISGQEYRSTIYGHLNLYLRDDLGMSGSRNITDNWPIFREVGRETIARHDYAFMAHGAAVRKSGRTQPWGPSAPSNSCISVFIVGSNYRMTHQRGCGCARRL